MITTKGTAFKPEKLEEGSGFEYNLHILNTYDNYVSAWFESPRDRLDTRRRILSQLYTQLKVYMRPEEVEEVEPKHARLFRRNIYDRNNETLLFVELNEFKFSLMLIMDRLNLLLERSDIGIIDKPEDYKDADLPKEEVVE